MLVILRLMYDKIRPFLF